MTRGRFYLRSESAEWDFIRSLKAPLPFDAAIVSDRYLADYPDGHARYGEDRDHGTTLLHEASHYLPFSRTNCRTRQK